MDSFHLEGGCHCGAIRIAAELTRPSEDWQPRACTCDFCRKHAAAYVSDPAGRLRITLADPSSLGRYRQGSGSAECLFCSRCGVLVGIAYSEQGRSFATLNSRVVEGDVRFGEPLAVSPQTLNADDKKQRWQALWFGDVTLIAAGQETSGDADATPGAPADIRIEAAQSGDAEALLALQQRAYASEARLYNDWTIPPLTQEIASLREEIGTLTFFKASAGGAIVGSVRAHVVAGCAQIGRLIVDPPRQRQGIGSALLRAIEAALPGAERFELFTGSRSAGNLRLYERHGYRRRETRRLSERVSIVYLDKRPQRP